MRKELFWLTCTTVMTALFWLPYVLNRMKEIGIWTTIASPNADITPRAPWARRMMAAHRNAIENLIIFAVLVLALDATGISSSTTVMACMIYFLARLVHFVTYSAGIPLLRTLSFVTGFGCQMSLAWDLLRIS